MTGVSLACFLIPQDAKPGIRLASWISVAEDQLCSSLPKSTIQIPVAIQQSAEKMVGNFTQYPHAAGPSWVRSISPAEITRLCPQLSTNLRLRPPILLMMGLPRCSLPKQNIVGPLHLHSREDQPSFSKPPNRPLHPGFPLPGSFSFDLAWRSWLGGTSWNRSPPSRSHGDG